MFKFFPDEKIEGQEKGDLNTKLKELRESKEVEVKQLHYDIALNLPTSTLKNKPQSANHLKYIRVADLLESSYVKGQPKVRDILGSTSDLLSGDYEGGFKIWECTFDLLTYLETNKIPINSETKVLDLGCGSGLLGLYALSKGASVVFQDYNEEVADFLTIPNTITNFGDEGLAISRYFSGDWGSFHELIKRKRAVHGETEFKFDLILSSETIYNTEYLNNFISILKTCLKPTGSIYVAAKTCYFGVGGGTRAFTSILSQDSSLISETVEIIRQGIQREILKIRSTI